LTLCWSLARADDPDKPLNLWQLALAGGWAGFVNSFIISPVELVKTRLQIQYNAPTSFFGTTLSSLSLSLLFYVCFWQYLTIYLSFSLLNNISK
jgi:hypothetical protein